MLGWEFLREEDRATILRGLAEGEALGGPYHAEIDPIDVCNAECFFCCSAIQRAGSIFPWERLNTVLDDLIAGGLRSARIAGGGEPLLYPEFDRLCGKLAENDVPVQMITTNGIRMDERTLPAIVEAGTRHICVSLNYVDEPQYAEFMQTPGDFFPQIVTNVYKLDAALRVAGTRERTNVILQMMVHHSTVEDIPRMVDLGLELPVDWVALRSVGYVKPEEDVTPHDRQRIHEHLRSELPRLMAEREVYVDMLNFGQEYHDQTMQIFFEAHQAANFAGEWTGKKLVPYDPKTSLKLDGIESCFVGWYSIAFLGSGASFPCCFLMHEDGFEHFGDLTTNSLQEVWQGPKFRKHRHEMKEIMMRLEHPVSDDVTRSFTCTTEACYARDRCSLAGHLADKPFYQQMHDMLEKLRTGNIEPATPAQLLAHG